MRLAQISFANFQLFYPWRESACRHQRGQFFFTFALFYFRNVYNTFKIILLHKPFWDIENILSRIISIMYVPFSKRICIKIIFGLGNIYWTFNLQTKICLFETLEMFYPTKGLRKQYWRWSINCFYLCFIPQRDCESNTVGGPIGFYLCIPWRDCESRTVGGPIVFTCVYPPGSKSKALRLGVHLILLYFISLGVRAKPYG